MERSRSPGRNRVIEEAAHELQNVKSELEIAKKERADNAARIERLERKLVHAEQSVEQARDAALTAVPRRSVLVAYALWLFTPLIWPGGYLFYLGRDAHAMLSTATFGGFGLGWALDVFYIPQYAADHDDLPGYREQASRRLRRWWSPGSLLAAPMTLLLQLFVGFYAGIVCAYLVPRPAADADADAKQRASVVGFCVGMFGSCVAVRLAATRVGRSRCSCGWSRSFGWAAFGVSALVPTLKADEMHEAGCVPQLFLGTLAAMLGVALGRREDASLAPRRNTRQRTSGRLLRHVVVCSAALGGAVGAFALNGSYTHTNRETGETTTYTGREALGEAWSGLGALGAELSRLRQANSHKSWAELGAELRAAFRDPAVEAAEVLGVPVDATAAAIKSAHRKLALAHHPDKVDAQQADEAKVLMARINWAKEVMLKARAA